MSDTPNMDPRTELAGKRTTLATFRTAQALDRTTLAWIRTTLTMGSFGFGMIGFFRTVEPNRRLTGLGCGRCGSKASQRAEFAEDVQEHQQISARVVQGRFAHAFANAFNV